MSQYEVYRPIAITADNFRDFTSLLSSGKGVMPTEISKFVTANENHAYREIIGPSLLVVPGDNKGSYVQIRLFTADKSNPPVPSRMAALFMDILPLGDGKFSSQPRQWLLGQDVQAVIPYKMSCCSGLSAIAAYKQGGKLQPALLENAKFVLLSRTDLFSLAKPGESGLKVDPSGDVLRHWYTHLMRMEHDCGSHARITVPRQLPAFRGR